ncbi:MAG: transposase [Candidatus Melainabacteria bacterium]|nr:transposase [Candidatus Melainabacteria bacterium]
MKQILPKLKEVSKYLSFLKNCFTKPQFSHATKYISGLIALNKKTIKNISSSSKEGKNQSNLNRFLTESEWDEKNVQDRYIKKINHQTRGKPVSLVIDDSISKKTGKHIEEAQYHKDHAGKGYVFGHQIVTALIVCMGLLLPLFPKLYSKKTQSKIELAKQIIEYASSKIRISQVIIDSWYVCNDIIKLCLKKDLTLIGNIKSNRLIKFGENDWIKLGKYYRSISRKKKAFQTVVIDDATYKIHSIIVRLKKVGFVKIIISRQWMDDKKKWSRPFYIICTDVSKSDVCVLIEYTKRWSIETFHKDIKQCLGLEAYQMRLKKGITRHLILVTLSYAILKLMMFFKKVSWTIGECIKYIQDKEFDDLIIEVVCIDDRNERIRMAKEMLLNENAKV